MSLMTNTSGVATTIVAPASSTEMTIPFSIDANGAVATTADAYQNAIAHLLSLAMTNPSERVMRPTYGVGLSNMIFDNGNALSFQGAAMALQNAFSTSETSIATVQVTVVSQGQGSYAFQVQFTIDQDPVVHQAIFNYSGQLVGSS